MRYTLLEMVQQILSAMDSDEVNSYSDTVESVQVAQLLKGVYYDLAVDLQLPEHDGLFELNPSNDNTKPTLMFVPSNVCRIDWIRYNNVVAPDTRSEYKDVYYKPFREFMDLQTSLVNETTIAGEMTFTNNGETYEVCYWNDRMPTWFTSVDDYTLIFDAYMATEDTTLQKSKTQCAGAVYPTWTMNDDFTPDLDPTQFSYFLNRAKVRAFTELKQAVNNEAAAETRIQKIRNQRVKRRVPDLTEHMKLPNYGR